MKQYWLEEPLSVEEFKFVSKALNDVRSKKKLITDKIPTDRQKDIYFDVDSTLILYESGSPNSILISQEGYSDVIVSPHIGHILKIKQLKADGHRVCVWSAAGAAWSKAVVKALGLENYVDFCLEKPDFYFDDLNSSEWMGKRLYENNE